VPYLKIGMIIPDHNGNIFIDFMRKGMIDGKTNGFKPVPSSR